MKKLKKLLYILSFCTLANTSFAAALELTLRCSAGFTIVGGVRNDMLNDSHVPGWGEYTFTNSNYGPNMVLDGYCVRTDGADVDNLIAGNIAWWKNGIYAWYGSGGIATPLDKIQWTRCGGDGGTQPISCGWIKWYPVGTRVWAKSTVHWVTQDTREYYADVYICGTNEISCPKAPRGTAVTLDLHAGKEYLFVKDGSYLLYNTTTSQVENSDKQYQTSDDFNGITREQAKSIKAAISYDDNKHAYFFFNDGSYLSYDLINKKVEGTAKPISSDFRGVSSSDALNLVAVANDKENNLLFILQDGYYLAYDVKQRAVKSGYPHLLSEDFPGTSATQGQNSATGF